MLQNGVFNVVTILHHKNTMYISSIFLSNKEKLKSKKGNGFWTFLKMSKNEKPKIVLKMALFLHF
jgi:hypothetical protein